MMAPCLNSEVEGQKKARKETEDGNNAYKAENFEKALEHYNKAIELDPFEMTYRINSALALFMLEKYENCIKECSEAIELGRKNRTDFKLMAKASLRVGMSYQKVGDYKNAKVFYAKSLSEHPSSEASSMLEGVKKKIMEEERNLAEAKAAQARQRPNLTNPFADPSIFLKLKNDPRTSQWMNDPDYLALVRDLQTNPNSLGQKINDPRVMTTLSVLLGMEIADGAEEMDTEEAPPKPATPPPPKKDPEPELPEEKKAALKEKENGNNAYKAKNFEKALEHYNKALELDPSDMTYRLNIAAVHFELKKYEDCIKECLDAIELGRENRADFKLIAKAFLRVGNSYKKLGDYKNAKVFYEKSLSEHRTPEMRALQSHVNALKSQIKLERESFGRHLTSEMRKISPGFQECE